MKISQRKWIESQLREHGEITRNQCLQNYISRLGARINDMEADGWLFQTFSRKGDYVYKLLQEPKRIEYVPVMVDGRIIRKRMEV